MKVGQLRPFEREREREREKLRYVPKDLKIGIRGRYIPRQNNCLDFRESHDGAVRIPEIIFVMDERYDRVDREVASSIYKYKYIYI